MGKRVSIANLSIAVGNWQRRTRPLMQPLPFWPEGWVLHWGTASSSRACWKSNYIVDCQL